MNLQTPRGTRDLLPQEMKMREAIFGKLKAVVESYGFQPIETPAFESFELLSKKSGEQIREEIYFFKDKSDRPMGLRFDGTVPVARVVASNTAMPKPIKFYYLSRFWRYDEPQAGRLREFWQLGVELIGSKSSLADAEVIACAVDCLKAVGLTDFEVRVNSRKIVDGLAKHFKINDVPAFFRLLDKMEKIPKGTFESEVEKLGAMELFETLERIEKARDISYSSSASAEFVDEHLRSLMPDNSEYSEGERQVRELLYFLESYGLRDIARYDPMLVRGIGYYDGLVFEVKAGGYKLTIVGGGRYDGLIGLYGPEKLPATGWAMGLERLLEVLGKEGELPAAVAASDVLVVPIDKSLEKDAVKIAKSLRAAGLSCDLELMERGLGKSLECASKAGVKFVVIVGKNEAAEGKAVLKDMAKKTEEKVSMGEIATIVMRAIKAGG